MTTLDQQVSDLTDNTNALLASVAAKKPTLDGYLTTIAGSATASTTSEATALASYNAAVLSSNSAQLSTDLAQAAWNSVSAPNETLAAINKTFFTASGIVAAIIYDTKKDSDGGAWRKRCQSTSWYNETVYGNYLGERTTEAAARAMSGATTNDFFHNTTDGKFYALNATSGVTEVFRGNRREFPEVVAITAEAGRVIIWDLTDSSVPMWMVFKVGTGYLLNDAAAGRVVGAVSAINGDVYVGLVNGSNNALSKLSFIKDTGVEYFFTGLRSYSSNIALRNSAYISISTNTAITILAGNVNSIAATVLPNAPIDPTTGLPVPTIAVGTAGGVSVIKDDGTVVNPLAGIVANFVSYCTSGNLLIGRSAYSANLLYSFRTDLTNFSLFGYIGVATYPNLSSITSGFGYAKAAGDNLANFSNAGLTLIRESVAVKGNSLVATITNTYNSGWMNGDIRGAWLADTVAETVSGPELVTNGTFTVDAAGWTAGNAATLAVVAGELTVTNAGATNGYATQVVTTVVGKSYRASCIAMSGLGTSANLYVGSATASNNITSASTTSITRVPISVQFIATGTTTYISVLNFATSGMTNTYNNISVIECAADRSVKANPLTVYGQLSKTQAASGNNMVAYSGFSMKNYMEQPYSANLDYGTGDFYYGFWGTFGGPGWDEYPWSRTSITPVLGDIQFRWGGSANPGFEWYNGSAWVGVVSTSSLYSNGPYHKMEVVRRSGVIYLYANGVQIATATFTGSVSSASPFRIGNSLSPSSTVYALSYHTGNLALLRTSATAPSADQIAYMYETERKLFEPGAQCTIDGSSTAVTALAYDEISDLLHVGTSWGRSSFKGLTRAYSEASSNGAAVSYACNDSDIIQVGATGAKLLMPPIAVRDELLRSYEQKKAFSQKLIGVDFDAITAQTAFVLPLGMKARSVTSNGNTMRLGSAKDYTISNDGFRDTVNFNVAPGAGIWVNVQCTRSY